MSKELEFDGDFHRLMYQYTKSKFYSAFIFSTSLINTAVLIAQTWRVVLVRAGDLDKPKLYKTNLSDNGPYFLNLKYA